MAYAPRPTQLGMQNGDKTQRGLTACLNRSMLLLQSIYSSFSLLNRCVPDYFNSTAIEDKAAEVVKVINADDFARKVLSDLYETWKEMLILCLISLS